MSSVGRSNLVEGGDVDGLNLVLEGLDGFLEVISADLEVLNNTTDDELLDTVGDGDLLVLGLPEEAVLLDGEDLGGEGVEVGLGLVGLDLVEDQRLGNGADLLGSLLGLLLLGLKSSLGLLNN